MKRHWSIAPAAARKITLIALITCGLVIPLQLLSLYLLLSELTRTLTTVDPFAVLAGGNESVVRPWYQLFLSGLVTSTAATMGTFAIVSATRLVVPYRNRSLRVVQVAGASHLLLCAATVVGVLVGNRALDAGTSGTLLSVVWVLPVFALSFHPMVRAWSVVFTPPPPTLPELPAKR